MDKTPVNISPNLIKHFADYLRLELSLSDNSVEAYCHDVHLFLQYLEAEKVSTDINAITQETIENFFAYLFDLNIKIEGDIIVDSISTLELSLKEGSEYIGKINNDNSAKSIKLTIDNSSKITLTGDTYVTSLEDEDTSYSNINFNGYKLYVNGKSIN